MDSDYLRLSGRGWKLSRTHLWDPSDPPINVPTGLESIGEVAIPASIHKVLDLPDYLLDSPEVIGINNSTWVFERSFEYHSLAEGDRAFIQLDSVDYFADVWLNGMYVGHHEGMFTDFELEVTSQLKPGLNDLTIAVSCPWRVDSREFSLQPSTIFSVNRKSTEYMKGGLLHYWDGSPFSGNAMFPLGIYGEISIVTRQSTSLKRTAVSTISTESDTDTAQMQLHVEYWSAEQTSVRLVVSISPKNFSGQSWSFEVTCDFNAGDGSADIEFTMEDPRLWWTWDLGEQSLYSVRVTGPTGQVESTFGVRTLVRDPVTFEHRLNGVRLFLRGVWYPMSTMFPADERSEEIVRDLDMLVGANVNHFIVYTYVETPLLYEQASERGLLVFQELPFVQLGPMRVLDPAHPRHDIWVVWASAAVGNIVRRLRGHACLVAWAAFAETRKDGEWLYGDYGPFSNSLKSIIEDLDPDSLYHPSFCDFGEDHFWEGGFPEGEFWDHRFFNTKFVSEFGSIAPPGLDTLKTFVDESSLWGNTPASEGRVGLPIDVEELSYQWSFDYPGLTNSIARLFQWVDREVPTLQRLIDGIQWYQATGIRYAAELYRRRRFDDIAGCRIWSYRDVIPGVRFSVVDHLQRPKMGYHALRQAYSPLLLSIDDPLPLGLVAANADANIDLAVVNDLAIEHSLRVTFEVLDPSGRTLASPPDSQVHVGADSVARLSVAFSWPTVPGSVLLRAVAWDPEGHAVAQTELWKRVVAPAFEPSRLRVLLLGQARYNRPFVAALGEMPGIQLITVDEVSRNPQDISWSENIGDRCDVIWFTGWDEAARHFRSTEFQNIADAVEAGVGFIHTGGQASFHGGDGRGAMLDVTPLADVLPVIMRPHEGVWDLIPDSVGAQDSELGHLVSGWKPTMHHRLTPKEDALVHATIGQYPLLVTGEFGAGVVATVAGGFVQPIRKFAMEFQDPDATVLPWTRDSLRSYREHWEGIEELALELLAFASRKPLALDAKDLVADMRIPLFEHLSTLSVTSLSAIASDLSRDARGWLKGVVEVSNTGSVVARLVRGEFESTESWDSRFFDGFSDLMPGDSVQLRFEGKAPEGQLSLRIFGQNTETVLLSI